MKRIAIVLALVVGLFAGVPSAHADALYVVPASIPNDCSVDVSAQLNGFIASVPDGTPGAVPNYSVIQFRPGCYKIHGWIHINRRHYLKFTGKQTFGVDTVIESDDVDDSGHQPAIKVRLSDHVYLDNFTINGDNPNPGYYKCGPPEEEDRCRHEFSHGVIFKGSHDVGLSDSKINNVRGDGVTFAPEWDGNTPVNMYNGYARNADVDGCGRMGFAFTGGHDIVWENSDLRNCPWIFDLENEWSSVGFGIENVTIRNNTTGLYQLAWLANHGGCGTHNNILVEGNVMERSGPTSWSPITVEGEHCQNPRTGYVIRDNTFRMLGWGSADYGVTLKGTVGAIIEANTFIFDVADGNNYMVRLLESTDVQIIDNTMVGGWHLVKNLGGSSWFVSGNFCGEMTPCQEQ